MIPDHQDERFLQFSRTIGNQKSLVLPLQPRQRERYSVRLLLPCSTGQKSGEDRGLDIQIVEATADP